MIRGMIDAKACGVALLADYVELTKPRLTLLAVLTTTVAFFLGLSTTLDLRLLGHTLLGTAMMCAGAATLNHVIERDVDGRMWRTRNRPLPARRVRVQEAAAFGVLLSLAGVATLWILVNALTGLLALIAVVVYVLMYTPLKTVTPLCMLVGAVPGAMPSLIGWTAVRGYIGIEGIALSAILFYWQLPHFLAIAWMYRHDFARAGLPVLPVVHPDGDSTFRQILLWSLTLVPISTMPGLLGMTRPLYLPIAVALGIAFLAVNLSLAARPTHARARAVLLASIVYLSLIQIAMLVAKASCRL